MDPPHRPHYPTSSCLVSPPPSSFPPPSSRTRGSPRARHHEGSRRRGLELAAAGAAGDGRGGVACAAAASRGRALAMARGSPCGAHTARSRGGRPVWAILGTCRSGTPRHWPNDRGGEAPVGTRLVLTFRLGQMGSDWAPTKKHPGGAQSVHGGAPTGRHPGRHPVTGRMAGVGEPEGDAPNSWPGPRMDAPIVAGGRRAVLATLASHAACARKPTARARAPREARWCRARRCFFHEFELSIRDASVGVPVSDRARWHAPLRAPARAISRRYDTVSTADRPPIAVGRPLIGPGSSADLPPIGAGSTGKVAGGPAAPRAPRRGP